jgi:hypothetical protein
MCDTRRILTVDPVHYKVHPLERQKVNVIQFGSVAVVQAKRVTLSGYLIVTVYKLAVLQRISYTAPKMHQEGNTPMEHLTSFTRFRSPVGQLLSLSDSFQRFVSTIES